jgi:hypothetical protein
MAHPGGECIVTQDTGADRQSPPVRPTALPVNVAAIPMDLDRGSRWVVWRYELRGGKWTKPPYSPNGTRASHSDATTWALFADVVATHNEDAYDGIGLVLSPDDDLAGIDIDHCVDEAGEIHPWARALIDDCDSYAELSPSGHGIRIFARGRLPGGGRKFKRFDGIGIEVYDSLRYLTVTGHRIGSQTAINPVDFPALVAREMPEPEAPPPPPERRRFDIVTSDDDLLELARKAKNGTGFALLFDRGDASRYGDDVSSADLALCNLLAFWFDRDSSAIDRVFRRSALMRDKWDEPHFAGGETYGHRTILKAIANCREVYKGRSTVPHSNDFAEIERKTPQQNAATDDGLPEINAGEGDLCLVTAQSLDALKATNSDTHLVRYAGGLCRLKKNDYKILTPERVTRTHVRDELSRAANWYRVRTKKLPDSEESETVHVPSHPPLAVCENILVQAALPFPVLEAIVDIPIFSPDGSLHKVPGYDAKTKTYFDPAPGMAEINIPTHPTEDEINRARDVLLEDFMGDFPFASPSDKANAVGAILTPFIQQMDIFPIPAALYEAPVPGSGKSKLAELSLAIGAGSRLKASSQPPREEEAKKVITSAVLANFGVLLIDNIEGRFSSPTLAFALTTPHYTDRLLGGNEMLTMPWRLIVVLTANNAVLDQDLVRRSYRIRIDPQMERPQDRTGFRQGNLHGWCRENRPSLAQAALTLIMAWVAADRPPGKVTMGSFDRWAKTIGGILDYVGIPGFLANARQFSETANRDSDDLRAFVRAWYAEFGEKEVTTKDVLHLADDLPLGDGTDPAKRKRLGTLLAKYRDRVFDLGEDGHELSLCLKVAGITAGSRRWKTVRGGQGDRGGHLALPREATFSEFVEFEKQNSKNAYSAQPQKSPSVPLSPSNITKPAENDEKDDFEDI